MPSPKPITHGDARWIRRHLRRMCANIALPNLAHYVQVEFPAYFKGADSDAAAIAISGLYIEWAGAPSRKFTINIMHAATHPFRIRISRSWWQRSDRSRRLFVLGHELAHLITGLRYNDTCHHGKKYRRVFRLLMRGYRVHEERAQ